jgi:hypothetical protein
MLVIQFTKFKQIKVQLLKDYFMLTSFSLYLFEFSKAFQVMGNLESSSIFIPSEFSGVTQNVDLVTHNSCSGDAGEVMQPSQWQVILT